MICPTAAAATAAPAAADDDVRSGTAPWQYRYRPDLLQLPAGAAPENGHGLARDAATGYIYYTFQPKAVTPETRCLVRFDPDGTNAVMLGLPGPSGLSRGIPHGLRIEHDPRDNTTYLYHANNAASVFKTDLSGNILWEANFSSWQEEMPQFWPIKPTQTVVVPGSDVLLLADGYGSSWVHQLDKHTGRYLGRSFGGIGNATSDPVKFNTPHGINVDPRRPPTSSGLATTMAGGGPAFAVSDRSNNRLAWVDADGKYLGSEWLGNPPGMALPCNVDFLESCASEEQEDCHHHESSHVAAVPSLGASFSDLGNGSVAVYSAARELLSVIEVARLIGHLGHQHPHDAVFLANGDLVVCCWSGPSDGPAFGPALGVISYWERVSASDEIVI